MTKEFNYIYEQLVESEDDIHGIISYSVYKRQKIQFITDFKEKSAGADPKAADLKPFNDLSMSPAQLEFYRIEQIFNVKIETINHAEPISKPSSDKLESSTP